MLTIMVKRYEWPVVQPNTQISQYNKATDFIYSRRIYFHIHTDVMQKNY